MQRTFHSFEKNAKERENVAFFWKERMPNPVQIWQHAKKRQNIWKDDNLLHEKKVLTVTERVESFFLSMLMPKMGTLSTFCISQRQYILYCSLLGIVS